MPGTVLTVASGKGGVGKTTTAVNLAVALWREENAVAMVDADLGMANLAAVLGLEPEQTLHDVLAGRATLAEVTVEAKDGDLLVVPGERDLAGFADADPAELQSVLDALAERCDYVIVDTGAGLAYEDVLPLGLADEVLLVTTPDPAAIGDTRKTLQLSGLLDGRVRGVVVTRVTDEADGESAAAQIGTPLLGSIPQDRAVVESTTEGVPLESHAPDAPATIAYRNLARTIVDGDGGGAGRVDGEAASEVGEGDAAEDEDTVRGPAADTGDDSETGHVETGDESSDDAEAHDSPPDDDADAELPDAGTADDDPADDADPAPSETGDDDPADDASADPSGGDGASGDPDGAATSEEGQAADADVPDERASSDADAGGSAATAAAPGETEATEEGTDARAGANESEPDASGSDEPAEESGGGRGGFRGWLGRLFS